MDKTPIPKYINQIIDIKWNVPYPEYIDNGDYSIARLTLNINDNKFNRWLSMDSYFAKYFNVDLEEYRKQLLDCGGILINGTTYFQFFEDLEKAIEYINSLIIMDTLVK